MSFLADALSGVLGLFAAFWAQIEREFTPAFWRVSLFFYEKLQGPPYFTYYRGTWWLDHEPTREELGSLSMELEEEIETETDTLYESPRVEVEQFLEGESAALPTGSFRLSRSEGKLPSEDFVGLGQTRLDEFDEDYLES